MDQSKSSAETAAISAEISEAKSTQILQKFTKLTILQKSFKISAEISEAKSTQILQKSLTVKVSAEIFEISAEISEAKSTQILLKSLTVKVSAEISPKLLTESAETSPTLPSRLTGTSFQMKSSNETH